MSFIGIAQHPIFKAVLQIVPAGIGSAIDVFLADGARQIQEDRLHVFFDELATGGVELTPQHIENQDFLHCFFATTRAASRTRRAEKIRLFARLLKNGALGGEANCIDAFEEALSALDDLSFREWEALNIFDSHRTASISGEHPAGDRAAIWPVVCDEISVSLGIERIEVFDFLHRTTRTGLFRGPEVNMSSTGHGTTTPAFTRLKSLVAAEVA